MQNDSLQLLLEEIKKECKKLNINLYPGRIDDSHPVVVFTEFEDNDWKAYLQSFIKAESKLLILTIRTNDTGPWEETPNPKLTLEENEETRKDNQILNETRGLLAFFTLSFFGDGACFQYEKWADWALPYQELFLEPEDDFSDFEFIEGNQK